MAELLTHALTVGFMPLVDCAPVVVAAEKGFAEAEGLDLVLVRETSWANIRDRVALGHFDAAHMLGPMPIASSLGLGRPAVPVIAPFSLGLGGNAITVSPALWAAMGEPGFDPADTGRTLAAAVRRRQSAGEPQLALAVVHPFSAHAYELRYWLAAAGLDPEHDLRLTVLPPSQMGEAIANGGIDGFCAGEPWGSLAVERGAGVIAVTKSALWRQGPDKVLGVRADFADRFADRLAALIRALWRAAGWAGAPENRDELCRILARPDRVGVPEAVVARSLAGRMVRVAGRPPEPVPDFLVFHDHAANFPWVSHALWFYSQMVRWGQTPHGAAAVETVRGVYRPDLYRAALAPIGADLPRASAKVEGALTRLTPVASRTGTLTLGPDGFFDGRLFDPDRIDEYLAGLPKAADEKPGRTA